MLSKNRGLRLSTVPLCLGLAVQMEMWNLSDVLEASDRFECCRVAVLISWFSLSAVSFSLMTGIAK